MKRKIKVFDILNSLITPPDVPVHFIKAWISDTGYMDEIICTRGDDYYIKHREDIYNYYFDFMSIYHDKINIFIKEVKE